MRALPTDTRDRLKQAVIKGRQRSESEARAALERLGMGPRGVTDRPPTHLSDDDRALRRGLLTKLRQLGGDFDRLVEECAYEQWHQLLFPRFLAENELLLHPHYRTSVTLMECEELAEKLGEPDGWMVAARFAAEILPGIFRLDDPCVRLRLAPEGRQTLGQIVSGLPPEVFRADDALGWVYQFWQLDKKDEVNQSERRIGAGELGPVTQLFTENYMVRFLLENSLGAWWAARHPGSPLVKGFEFLRFDAEGRPAAGTFESWPGRVAEVTVMDPCCGSGHFLVEAFGMLWRMRAEEEGIPPVAAQDAVLGENLFGLELDARCVQIAIFVIALAAWKSGGGWRELPIPSIACSGISAKASANEWIALARDDDSLKRALERLHTLFKDADTLGSLIDPRRVTEFADAAGLQRSFEDVDFEEVAPLLQKATQAEAHDPATAVLGADAAGIARAADLLSRRYCLVATNVPYLSRRGQSATLLAFLESHHYRARFDLATAFIERNLALVIEGGTAATVTPQNWLFLTSYTELRREILEKQSINLTAWLGDGAFEEISGSVVNVSLVLITRGIPTPASVMATLDVSSNSGIRGKTEGLRQYPVSWVERTSQLNNPDARILSQQLDEAPPLKILVHSHQGIATGDSSRFIRSFWEAPQSEDWQRLQSTVGVTQPFGGRSNVIWWEHGRGALHTFAADNRDRLHDSHMRGKEAWGSCGVAISQLDALTATIYEGDKFDSNVAVLIPRAESDLPSIWAFVSSPDYRQLVRQLDRKMNVTNSTLAEVPFDAERWRGAAAEAGPLPSPWSDDPTQWLFEGRPEVSIDPLQVAVARLVGFRWPEQPDSDDLDRFADADGIVCLPPVVGEPPAAERLQRLLVQAFGKEWGSGRLRKLLEQSSGSKKELAEWLRDDFFKLHCKLFHNRPFVWHVWDGRKDGFSALVNYHRLDRPMLEKLTHTYLGQDWIERQRAEAQEDAPGAEARLAAAENLRAKLNAILEGEPPYDIYVRWKDLREQPLGWQPDLNDGVRLNVRPFVEAGVLRSSFNVHWRTDRGKNPDGSGRRNDQHCTIAEKLKARQEAGLP